VNDPQGTGASQLPPLSQMAQMNTSSIVNEQINHGQDCHELSLDEMKEVNGGAVWGIVTPAAAAFAVGYGVGTLIYKNCSWARWA